MCTWRSPRTCPSSTSARDTVSVGRSPHGRAAREGAAAGRAPRTRRPRPRRSGSGSSALHERVRAGRAEELRPEARRRRRDDLDRHAVDGDADGAVVLPLDHRDDLGQRREPVEHGVRSVGRHDDREPLRRVAPAARVAGDLAAERVRDRACERPGAVERAARAAAVAARPRASPARIFSSVFGPIPGSERQASGLGCGAQLVDGADAEAATDLGHPRRPDADQPPEPDELRRQLGLELAQLGDLAGLDQLAQAALDAGADAGELAHASAPDELGDRRRRRAHQLGRASVGAHARTATPRRGRAAPRTPPGARRSAAFSTPVVSAPMARIVVPFRGAGAKLRLAPLGERERGELALAMLGDVVTACVVVGATTVVTEDAYAAALARRARRESRRTTPAAARAPPSPPRSRGSGPGRPGRERRRARASCRTTCGRCSGRRRRAASPTSTAADGTTNALGLPAAELFAPLYGPGSAERFRAHAEALASSRSRSRSRTSPTTSTREDDLRRVGPARRAEDAGRDRLARPRRMKVVALSGGVGGARFLRGLVEVVDPRA